MKITRRKRSIRSSRNTSGRRIVAWNTLDSKRSTSRPYAYATKHGVGPGMLPKDVELVDWEDLDDNMTLIYVDRPLSTKELEYYDIYPETKLDAILKQYGKKIGASSRAKRRFTIKANKNSGSKIYEITYDHYKDTVVVDSFESEQDAVDKLIDKLEAEGSTGCFVNPDEYNEDEYVIGGNHGLALYTGGNFRIVEIDDSDVVTV